MLQVVAAVFAVAVIVVVLGDTFETIVLPRRVTRRLRLTRAFYRLTWAPVAGAARRRPPSKKRDRYLSFYGPLSLLLLLTVWAVGLILAFALLQWSAGSPLHTPESQTDFRTYLYMSGVTFFTLGYGDAYPLDTVGRVL